MLSMTGYGTGEATSGPATVTVELRSVNHRFLDVGLKMPSALAPFEMELRQFLKENVARGRVSVSIQLAVAKEAVKAEIDPSRLEGALDMLKFAAEKVKAATGQDQVITLEHLLAVPDVLRVEEQELAAEDLKTALDEALKLAHAGLMTMKDQEGAALVKEMRQRLDTLSTLLEQVEGRAPEAAEGIRQKLEERLEKLLGDNGLDPQRLAQEVALLADKANINEEIERLGIHIGHFHAALDEGGQVAKRLNFLLQEMHREVNTMGSKTSVMDITQAVIAMKDEVESMREQIMNLE
jgi:uncharacterized protein (TIGR00255 family)